ncbi:MAG: hypothetical protein JNN08_13070 [Bryobacterales bacterium]|nr:hypothetical protein [Bryobacterales bacterium]
MIDTHDRPFRLLPRRPARPGHDETRAWSKAFQGLMRIVRMTSSRRASATPAARRPRQQRCAVRVTYSPNRTPGQWYAHGRYIEREGGTTTGIAKTLGEWQESGDERLFKIILSPEFGERMDLDRLAREFMDCTSRELGVPLEWAAAVHRNTDHPHPHRPARRPWAAAPARVHQAQSSAAGGGTVHRATRLQDRTGRSRVRAARGECAAPDFARPPHCRPPTRRDPQSDPHRASADSGTNGPRQTD